MSKKFARETMEEAARNRAEANRAADAVAEVLGVGPESVSTYADAVLLTPGQAMILVRLAQENAEKEES